MTDKHDHTRPWQVHLHQSKRFGLAVNEFNMSHHWVHGVQSNEEAEFNNRMMDHSAEMYRMLRDVRRYAPKNMKQKIDFVLNRIKGEW